MRENLFLYGLKIAFVVGILNSAAQAQNSRSLIYPQNIRVDTHPIKNIRNIPVTHRLLNTSVYKNIKRKLSKAKNNPLHFSEAKVGDTFSFHVRNVLHMDSWYQVTAECIYVSDKLAVWISMEDKQLFNDSLRISTLIDNLTVLLENSTPPLSIDADSGILQIDQKYFGNPPDVDGDGRLDILLLNIKDQFEETGSYVAGFFDPVNLIEHPFSNYRDMIYVDLYPSVIYQGEMKINQVAATIAHEYQHLIHANYEGETTQSVFINEGLSELAEILSGFEPRKPDAYFQAPARPLLSWNYSQPLPDYARASLFMNYLFEQIGFEHTKRLVQTDNTGVKALQEVVNSTSSLNFKTIFRNWGKAMLLNDRSHHPAFGYQHPARQDIHFTAGHTYHQLPDAGNFSAPQLSHIPLFFPLTKTVQLNTNHFYPDITLSAVASYPDEKLFYIGTTQAANARFFADDKAYGSIKTLISNAEIPDASHDSLEVKYNFLAMGEKSGNTVTMAYDDGIADAFLGHASFLLLNGTEDAYAVAFKASEPIWLYALNIKGIFLNELEGSVFAPEEPRDLIIQMFTFENGSPGGPLTPPIKHTFQRPLGNLRFETVSLTDFYPNLKALQDSFCVVIKNDTDDTNYFAVGLDHGIENNTWFLNENFTSWKPLSKRLPEQTSLINWNAMIRAEVVSSEQPITSAIGFPEIEYDYKGVRLTVYPPFEADTIRSSCFAELPDGTIIEGVPNVDFGNEKLTYVFPVQLGGMYTFHNRTISTDGQWVNRNVWQWKIPESSGFELSHNYPNPFNLVTTVPFKLLEAGNVQLSVYDILGRKIKTLPKKNYEAGPQSIRVDLSGNASGMYLIQMNVTRPNGRGTASEWQKVMLIK